MPEDGLFSAFSIFGQLHPGAVHFPHPAFGLQLEVFVGHGHGGAAAGSKVKKALPLSMGGPVAGLELAAETWWAARACRELPNGRVSLPRVQGEAVRKLGFRGLLPAKLGGGVGPPDLRYQKLGLIIEGGIRGA